MNIAIIGAGPIGGYAAYLLQKGGHSVSLYEEHGYVGCPIQCTGLLTSDFDQFGLPMESFLVNTFSKIEVFSPHQHASIGQKEYLVDRTKFDQFFVHLAVEEGAKLLLNHSFIKRESQSIIIRNSLTKEEVIVTPDIVIAADGPLSKTAKAYGLYHAQRQNYLGIQATVEGNFDPSTYQTYFGQETCPGLFAWIVPESKTIARVGLGTLKDTKRYFDTFMTEKGFKALDIQAGLIPLYHSKQVLHRENCYLLGDAAGFVKATTLGGLIPGLKQAECLAQSILEKKEYEQTVKPLHRRLQLHLHLQRILSKINDEDWDRLVTYINQPRIKKVLAKHTRDNPFPLVVKTLLKEPRLLYFGKYLF